MLRVFLIFSLLVCFKPMAWAQGGGHVGKRQQVQQSQCGFNRVEVIKGEAAEKLYQSILSRGGVESDLTRICTHPVTRVSLVLNRVSIQCFDHGVRLGVNRFKCYQTESLFCEHTWSEFWNELRQVLRQDPSCGGLGNTKKIDLLD